MKNFEDPCREKSLLGFCVMGGIFSEGIDLKHEALIGAAIVGTGLPMVCDEREILRQFYEERGMDGFAYAYQYPGMNKVLQAAGRVIRTQEDRGDPAFGRALFEQRIPEALSSGVGVLSDLHASGDRGGCRRILGIKIAHELPGCRA